MDKAYRLITERIMMDDAELQYLLDVSHGPFYRIKRALLAIYTDVRYERGWFRIKASGDLQVKGIDYWGALEPQKVKDT